MIVEDEALDKLVDEFQTAEKAITDVTEKPKTVDIRKDLIKAAEEGYITQKVEYIKCTNKALEKIHKAYEVKRKKDADAFLTDLLISQFSSILGGLDAIEDPKTLTDELKDNNILRKDVESAISVVSPYIPLIGLLGGIVIISRHIYQHKSNQKLSPAENMQIQSDIKSKQSDS